MFRFHGKQKAFLFFSFTKVQGNDSLKKKEYSDYVRPTEDWVAPEKIP